MSDPQSQADVIVVCQVFHPELISTGQTLTELVEELAALGLRITVIAAQPTLVAGAPRVPALLEHQGIQIHRTWSTRLPKTHFIGKLLNLSTFFASATWRILWRHPRTQLLLLTNPPYLPLLGWVCHLLRRQPFGVILFDIMPEQAELLNFIRPDGFVARVWRRFNQLWYRCSTYAVVLSQDMLDGAIKNANATGTPLEAELRRKTRIIHVWSDDRQIHPIEKTSSGEAVRLGVLGRFVVQYSGNHGRFHDLETLLKIARRFSPDEQIRFQFIGDGQKKKLVDEFQRLVPADLCYNSGYVGKELLADSLAMADLGVVAQLPGQERVCYPSKLLGIMAAGRATFAICPPDCEMGRMIRDDHLGIVIANGDVTGGREALLWARNHPNELRCMGANAARVLRERFTLRQAAQAYHDLITQICRASSP
ncbi:MAG: glycosyltransferase WbuB [Pedosphaera sp.]|nr:glycosyltransferase WbuB [Pedosphaera sp.]